MHTKNLFLMANFIFYTSAPAQTEIKELPLHSEIEERYTWNLSDIYPTDQDWEKDYQWVEENSPKYKNFEGKLGNSSKDLLSALKLDEEISIRIGRLYLYAFCSKDLDLSNSVTLGRYDRIKNLYSKVQSISSFYLPELTAIPEEKIEKYLKVEKELSIYKHFFNDLTRKKQHILPKEQEKILAEASEVLHVAGNTFDVFSNAELSYPSILDPSGNEIKLSNGRYMAAMYHTDREYRERAYVGFYKPYMEFSNTFASLLSGQIKSHIFVSRTRNYNSCLEASINGFNIPVHVYNNLVQAANDNVATLHRWIKLRKKVLGYTEYHPYDNYVTLFPSRHREYTYDTAVSMVRKALLPLGADYMENLDHAFANRRIDVYETKGKMSGAYSSGTTYGVPPYVLLNWAGQLNDVFTLAHEMGHNMHSVYSGKSQPYIYADYSTFLAEVASTCNEALLLDYLVENASSKEEKLSLLEKNITNIYTTFYRQVMFAEFEKVTHEKAEKGEPLTSESFTALYKEIAQKYFGPDMLLDTQETYTWTRIPHFYYNFYVYQYATSFAASQQILEKIKTEKQPAIDRYLKFLRMGSSAYPIDILKEAGVDMSSTAPVLSTIKKMNQLMDEMETLLSEK